MPVILNLTSHQIYQTALTSTVYIINTTSNQRLLILTHWNIDTKEIGSCMLKNLKIDYCGQNPQNLRWIFWLNWFKKISARNFQMGLWIRSKTCHGENPTCSTVFFSWTNLIKRFIWDPGGLYHVPQIHARIWSFQWIKWQRGQPKLPFRGSHVPGE